MYDVIVVGCGGIGAAAVEALSRRGAKVLGIDRFHPPHDRGSTHGATRLIRQAYFEDPRYLPLLKRSYALWADTEARAGERLYTPTGFLVMSEGGDGRGETMGAIARAHDVTLEALDAFQVRERFPAFDLPDGWTGLFEPNAGHLAVERCVAAQLRLAQTATLRFGERVTAWSARPGSVTVHTDQGRYQAGSLVLAPGAWAPDLVGDLDLPLVTRRGAQFWFGGEPRYHDLPCFAFSGGGRFVYGFPDLGEGVKVADYEATGILDDPLKRDPAYTEAELAPVSNAVRRFLPGLDPDPVRWSICMYTLTPDENFLLDRHPEHPHVSFFAGDSGHAYKFAPALGEVLAGWATGEEGPEDVAFLRRRAMEAHG